MAEIYSSQRRFEEAEPLAKRSLAIREKVLGPDHPHVAVCLNNLAQIERLQGRYIEAEPLYRRALAIWEKNLGPNHPDVAKGLSNLADFYHERGRDPGGRRVAYASAQHSGEGPGPESSAGGAGQSAPGGRVSRTGPLQESREVPAAGSDNRSAGNRSADQGATVGTALGPASPIARSSASNRGSPCSSS